MKRKKWSELEERSLLSKYSELLNSGALAKLKTREKKFKPIADHVNSLHHLQDPITFPFKWCWRDVSIKVQNMRHQYLGVKQKIRISKNEFNWGDGEIHWENFLKYKEVFGDIELPDTGKDSGQMNGGGNSKKYGGEGISGFLGDEMGLGYGIDSVEMEDEDGLDDDEDEEEECGLRLSNEGEEGAKEENEKRTCQGGSKLKKGFKEKRLRKVSAKVLELREMICRREEKRRDREWAKEEGMMEVEAARREREMKREKRLNELEEEIYRKERELEDMKMARAKREFEKCRWLDDKLREEKKRRMELEEKWEEEEMEWREKMVQMQIEHEKQMMQMHSDACQNQLQVLGAVARLVCQFFGSANDGLGGSLGTLPPQVMQNMQHPGGLADSGKPDAASPSDFL